jgi:cobalt-zinc-cadmium efflux system membrane fusion protein
MNTLNKFILAGLLVLHMPFSTLASTEDDHDGAGEHDEEQAVHLSAEQRKMAGIVSEVLLLQPLASEIRAPGEIQLNDYLTTRVTPRVAAQIVERHARLGDPVEAGQLLVTLSSVEMAQAQGDLLVAEREWRRVKKLGREVVSDQRYTEARVARELARARVLAFGMTDAQLKQLASGDASQANGSFQLLAAQPGTIMRDHFVVGELIEPGRVLFEISDESTLWVEANLTPGQALQVIAGSTAAVAVGGEIFQGRVTQVHHALDEDTRTLGVRIEVPNPDDRLHPGLFVDVRIAGSDTAPALAVPSEAVLRSPDGDWMVFVEHQAGEYKPVEVEVLRTAAGRTVIDGVEPGTRVVTQGTFFLQSELAKAGFNIHNH